MQQPKPHKQNVLIFTILMICLVAFRSAPGQDEQSGQPDQQAQPQFTLAIFSGNPTQSIPAQLWAPLESALQSNLSSNDPELQPLAQYAAQLQILRADQIIPGIVVTNSLTAYLHGDCTLYPYRITSVRAESAGVLGWVERHRDRNLAQIEPFLHVDCNHLAQLLQPQSAGRNAAQRNDILAQAIARVLLHEWLHVATQSPHHAAEGITKAQFGMADLLARPATGTSRASQLSPALSPSTSVAHGK